MQRLAAGTPGDLMQAERDIRGRIGDQDLDFAALAAVASIHRAANVIRNHLEQKVLAGEELSWAAFTVLFVLWIWGDQQTRYLAAEAGMTKGTLTGVLKTLEKRDLVRRRAHAGDGRLVLVSLEPKPARPRSSGCSPRSARAARRSAPAWTPGRKPTCPACSARSSARWRGLTAVTGPPAAPGPAGARPRPGGRPAAPRPPRGRWSRPGTRPGPGRPAAPPWRPRRRPASA